MLMWRHFTAGKLTGSYRWPSRGTAGNAFVSAEHREINEHYAAAVAAKVVSVLLRAAVNRKWSFMPWVTFHNGGKASGTRTRLQHTQRIQLFPMKIWISNHYHLISTAECILNCIVSASLLILNALWSDFSSANGCVTTETLGYLSKPIIRDRQGYSLNWGAKNIQHIEKKATKCQRTKV